MKICGIEIKSNEAIFACAAADGLEVAHVPLTLRKLALTDDEDAGSVKTFASQAQTFVHDNGITHLAIKKRSKKGEFAGGPVTFKIEGLLQLLDQCEVVLLSPQTISAHARKHDTPLPSTLNKYQWEAFKAAVAFSAKR
ncbi:DUF3010 family protein [Pseudomonas sp. dw_358]|uniref:DUF3010 family protein n=1 Tax=Pseudomonas sp. dw_358 TaxID=2720083 RepID=UPI001BD35BC7|nr:DUF3010 family protein [Pseudomonas sp. dw_358]